MGLRLIGRLEKVNQHTAAYAHQRMCERLDFLVLSSCFSGLLVAVFDISVMSVASEWAATSLHHLLTDEISENHLCSQAPVIPFFSNLTSLFLHLQKFGEKTYKYVDMSSVYGQICIDIFFIYDLHKKDKC